MKKIASILVLAMSLFSCTQAQQTEFNEQALSNTMKDVDKSAITFQEILKKHEGKIIVMDVWASWCGDCIKGMPKVKALQEKYPEVTYLFISMDKDYDSWTKGIEKYNVQGDHYLTNDGMKGVFGKAINLDWIPRYLVVDQTGKIALFKVIEADDEKLIEILESLK
ncbi:TlpA disulfide reductase family protein [uncultured Flavobacterium sp.]|mgnify:CR=1 FL=1|uniref:TlpA family protein disulfide reductase n=1 Tax=uncultured Flavobacterium sp. TaxID=165435 RepID=UPI0030CA1AC9|tara:strand:- start:2439 stop:2936 length:498 start_codon:yes stop_codon:yes gene_type:complete